MRKTAAKKGCLKFMPLAAATETLNELQQEHCIATETLQQKRE